MIGTADEKITLKFAVNLVLKNENNLLRGKKFSLYYIMPCYTKKLKEVYYLQKKKEMYLDFIMHV